MRNFQVKAEIDNGEDFKSFYLFRWKIGICALTPCYKALEAFSTPLQPRPEISNFTLYILALVPERPMTL